MFTDFFIKRPVFSAVCSILIVLVGLVGYTRLPVKEFPSIDPPVVSVSTTYPGANPRTVETEVTEILESQINGVEGIKTLTSESRESVSSITVQFELDRDIDVAAQEVRSRVAQAVGRLPEEVESPVVRKRSGDASPIMWFSLYSEDGSISNLELSDYADRFIVDALETVPGVSNIIIGGERRYAMRLWIDPQRLAARNLTVLEVEDALRRENVELPSGRVEGNTSEYPVRTLGQLQTPAEYENLVVRTTPEGTQIRLKDIGRAEIGAENERSFVRFKGKPAVGLGIVKLSTANILEVAAAVKAKMEQLAPGFPEGMRYELPVDSSEFVQLAIDEVWGALYLAAFLVILVIFFFLRDARATLIPAFTIPVSLVGAFGVMYVLGYSVNTLTLFSLTLATGLVVDDTIVVLENIVRYIEEKEMKPFRAAMAGMREVVFAVIATTVVLIAVFLPVGFSGGSSGRLFTEFALTLAGSVVISSFVALTLAPSLSARLLKSRPAKPNFLFRAIEGFLDRCGNLYASSLARVMSWKEMVVIGFFLSMAVTGILFAQLPQEFLPTEDRSRIITFVRAPQGVTIDYTDKVMRQVEEIYSQIPEVKAYFSVGAFGRGAPGQVDRGITFVRLNHWDERTEPGQSQQEIVGQLFGRFSGISEALVFPINPSSLPGAGFGQAVQLVLQGSNLDRLAEVSAELARRANELPQLVNMDTNLKLTKPELTIQVNRTAAADLGVSVRDISRTLQILLGAQEITNFNRGNRQYEVVVQADKDFRSTPDSIREIQVRTRSDRLVPLSNLVSIETTTTPPEIGHYNRFRAATIEGSAAPGTSLGEALAALENLAAEVVPPEMSIDFAGQSLEFKEAGQSTSFIFLLALAFIFLVLAAQFESFLDPIVILLAVPLSLFGAFTALFVAQLDLNVYSQIGLIMLIGLATKNSILIVEFANQQRDLGMGIEAAVTSAGQVRFRPILMTAFSTIFGLLPLVFSTGAGAASRVSISMAVVGGMLVSTALSLYVVPVFYAIAARTRSQFFQPKPSPGFSPSGTHKSHSNAIALRGRERAIENRERE